MSEELIAYAITANHREAGDTLPIQNIPKEFGDVYKLFSRMDEILTAGFRKKLDDASFCLGQCRDGRGGIFLDDTLITRGEVGIYCFFIKDGKEYGSSVSAKGTDETARIVIGLFNLKYPKPKEH